MKKEILVGGKKIVYLEEGEGPPFLIIHGFSPRPTQHFSRFQKILADQGYRVILLVLPGFEDNGNWELPEWGMQDYLECISDFINELSLKEFFLIGHSMGGAMAIRLAVSYPERIKVLVLLSPGILRPAKSCFWKWWLFLSGLRIFLVIIWLVNKSYYRFFFDKNKNKNKIMYRILKNIVAVENTVLYLSKISQPTVIFWGKRDFNYYLFGRSFVKRIPNLAIHVMPKVGHNLQEDAPEKIAELTKDFIEKIESRIH